MEIMMTQLEENILDLYDLGWTADEIGAQLGVNPNLAAEVIDEYIAMENEPDPGDDDGDHESALASAGWGTDEDYGGHDYDW